MDTQFAEYKELIEQQLEELTAEDVLGQSAQRTVELDQQCAIDNIRGLDKVLILLRFNQSHSLILWNIFFVHCLSRVKDSSSQVSTRCFSVCRYDSRTTIPS